MLVGLGRIGLFGGWHRIWDGSRRHRVIDVGLLRRRGRRN